MELRQLIPNEYEVSMKLSEYAFHLSFTPEEMEKWKKLFKPEQYWGIFEGEALQAKLTLIPFQIYLQGRKIEMGGIAGVATWPENRRKGHVASLLKHTLKLMKSQGQTVSMLHPFSFPFYRKFGWELFTEFKRYTIPVEQFPPKMVVPGNIVRDVSDILVFNSLYQSFVKRYNGTLVRDDAWWKEYVLKEERFRAVYYSASHEPQGYVLYEIHGKELTCNEFVYLNEDARSALWTFFSNHDSRIDKVKLSMVPSDDQLPYMLPDPRIAQEIVPYFMARIVDFKSFVEQYSFKKNRENEVHFTIRVSDATADWNSGCWKLCIKEDGKAEVTYLGDQEDIQTDLSTDIQTLSALFMGFKRPCELNEMRRLHGDPLKVTQLESLIPNEQTLLLDHF